MGTTKAKDGSVNHHLDVGKSAWASICAGIFYISLKEKKAYNVSTAMKYMLKKIEDGTILIDDQVISEFLDETDTSRGINMKLSVNTETNQMVVALRERMQRVGNRRITTAQAVHFALALAPRPFW